VAEPGGTISRRTLLLGSGATGLAASGAVVLPRMHEGRALLHRLGFYRPDADVAPSGLRLEDVRLAGGRAAALVRVGSGTGPVAGLVCLHGRNGDERFAFDTVRLHDFAAALGISLVIAGVDGGPSSYWHRRADGTDPLRAVVDEVVPLVRGRNGGGPVSIMGWSMGGYGALLAAQRHPGLFGAVVAASPAVFRSFEDAAGGAFDGPQDFAAHDVVADFDALQDMPVRIDCGRDDPFASVCRTLLARGGHVEGGLHEGFHEAGLWRSLAADHLRFVTERATAGAGRPPG
jgi:pimeloyl-ACP methyl ester carboxylesterase